MTKIEFFECLVRSAYAMHKANQQYMEQQDALATGVSGVKKDLRWKRTMKLTVCQPYLRVISVAVLLHLY